MTWLLEMKNITKTFGAVKAVDNVSLRLNAGEVVSLCGENGSGKSTLMKVSIRTEAMRARLFLPAKRCRQTIFAIPNAKASPLFIRSWRW